MKQHTRYMQAALLTLSVVGLAAAEESQGIRRGKPTPEQIAWHEMEIQMFVCLDPCTWQGREYDNHSTPLEEINPDHLDTDQWCRVAGSFGAKQILFVAKHTGGFCWWRTDTSGYGIKSTSWKEGKGDVLADLAGSCKKHGLRMGIYVYPGDDQWGAGIGSGGRTRDPAKQEEYNEVFRKQLTEVLTRYGAISEVWFDGSCVIEVGDILEKHGSEAVVFQGPHATIRWVGNEQGISPDPAWQAVKKKDALTGVATAKHSDPDGDCWLPMEMDTTLLDHKWFWAPGTDHMMKSLERLMEIYYKSVGRGGVLLLNSTPDTTGLIPESHVARYKEFGEAIHKIYENRKGETSGVGRVIVLPFSEPARVNHIITMEDIRQGHIVRAYEIDGLIRGGWKVLCRGTSIGYKKIDVIETVQVEGLRFRAVEAVDEPVLHKLTAFEAPVPRFAEKMREITWQKVKGWNNKIISEDWKTVEVDLTTFIREPGQYEVEFKHEGGETRLEAREAVVLMAGTEAPRLIEKLNRPNAYNINRTAAVAGGEKQQTTLRVTLRATGGDPWKGGLYIRRIP